MQEVTNLLNTYRESARGLWNNFLRVEADFDRVDAFAQICEGLFGELVLRPVGKRGYSKPGVDDPYPFFRLLPTVDSVPIMINRPTQDGNKYWDDPVTRVSTQGTRLLLIDYFDWDQLGFIDLQYYRAKVAGFEKHPEVVGREALLEVHYVKVIFEE